MGGRGSCRSDLHEITIAADDNPVAPVIPSKFPSRGWMQRGSFLRQDYGMDRITVAWALSAGGPWGPCYDSGFFGFHNFRSVYSQFGDGD